MSFLEPAVLQEVGHMVDDGPIFHHIAVENGKHPPIVNARIFGALNSNLSIVGFVEKATEKGVAGLGPGKNTAVEIDLIKIQRD